MRLSNATLPLVLLVCVANAGAAHATAMEGRAWGDIHVQTMDGAVYDFQSSGEFIASRSTAGDFEVQLRLESRGFSPNVSVATAVAVLVDTTRASVEVGREPHLFLDGEPAVLADGFLELPDGGRIERTDNRYEIYWSDGSVLTLKVRKKFINVYLRPAQARRATLSGLFGNFNGVAADDVEATLANLGSGPDSGSNPAVRAALTDLARTIFEDEDDERLLKQEASLFEYKPGQSTYSFRKPPPSKEATSAALSSSWRKRAEEACEQAGVTDPVLFEACVVDVGYTRDESFAEAAAEVQARDDANWDAELEARAR